MIHLINGRNNYLITNGTSIPENDLKMIQKVGYHLKLNEPLVIDNTNIKNFQKSDITVNGSLVQFLNCPIKFNKKSKYQNFEIISLHEQNKNINISTGYSNLKINKELAINFYIKSEGAFHLQIK